MLRWVCVLLLLCPQMIVLVLMQLTFSSHHHTTHLQFPSSSAFAPPPPARLSRLSLLSTASHCLWESGGVLVHVSVGVVFERVRVVMWILGACLAVLLVRFEMR